MSESMGSGTGDVSGNDKLLSALSYPLPLIGIIVLLSDMKNRPFMKFHAVQSIAFGVVVFVLSSILGFTVILACLAPVVWLSTLYPAWKTYQGTLVELPVITGFIKSQGWV